MRTRFLKIGVLVLALSPLLARAQFGSGIVYDPTQAAHAIQQIEQGQNIFTNSVKLADNAIATYNLAHQMAMSPQSLYQPFMSFSSVWMMVNQAANTYGNSQPWTNSANTGVNASYAYQQASVPRIGQLNGYGNLSLSGQQQIAAQGATSDINDSVTASNLQTLGTIRANSQQRQADINALAAASNSTDPTQQTELATLQRINRALILQLMAQQEANQISQANTLQQIVSQKQQQDALKATFQQANQFQSAYNAIAPSYAGAAAAMRYYPRPRARQTMNLLNWITQACSSLTSTVSPSVDAMGVHICVALATIMLVWFGVQEALASAQGGPGFSMGKFLNFFMLITFAYAMVKFYDSSIPGVGYSLRGFINGGAQYLVSVIGTDSVTSIQNTLNQAQSTNGPGIAKAMMNPYFAIVYVVIQVLIAALSAIVIAIIAYGAIGSAVIG